MNFVVRTSIMFTLLSFSYSVVGQSVGDLRPSSSCLAEVGGQVWIEDSNFIMGDDLGYLEESPAHEVEVAGFWIDTHEVTNAQFGKFVEETGYITVAERTPNPADWPVGISAEFLKPGSVLFTPPSAGGSLDNWWSWVVGTNWHHPEGPDSNIMGKDNYPVIHIAFEDAEAYAKWAGRSLPTEAQFELAARNKKNQRFAWDGNELAPNGHHKANTWQGNFPTQNEVEDGHEGLAPVGCYEANVYGIYDLIGNVWEWTSNWYYPEHNPADSINPTGPASEESYSAAHGRAVARVIKGGSYLCAENYCYRFRPAARESQDTGLGTSHIGFRTVLNPN
jgi:formylglycine-generating enzyme required for sulfatase activity